MCRYTDDIKPSSRRQPYIGLAVHVFKEAWRSRHDTGEHSQVQPHVQRSNAKSTQGLTLIEVLVSVVILVMVGTAVLVVLESVQQGSIATAQYNQTLGLATTLAEEIKDHYTNNQTAFTIDVPGDALGGISTTDYTLSIPLPGGKVSGHFMNGYTYQISCAYASSVSVSPNGTSNNTTASTNPSNYDAVYTVQVLDGNHQQAQITVPVHGVGGGP